AAPLLHLRFRLSMRHDSNSHLFNRKQAQSGSQQLALKLLKRRLTPVSISRSECPMRGPLSIGSLALVTALVLPVQARAHDPFSFSAGQLDVLTWTEMCSNTEISNEDLRFSTCASAELTLF